VRKLTLLRHKVPESLMIATIAISQHALAKMACQIALAPTSRALIK
jgi:hypothetical protein